MRKLLLAATCLFVTLSAYSQKTTDELVREAIALHDKKDFNGAIAIYDKVLEMEPKHHLVMYEKALSLMEQKQYDDALYLLEKVLKESKSPEIRRLSYTLLGTIHDYQGDGKKSLKVYSAGIKEFPESYLLHFNKAVTLINMNETGDAIESLKDAIRANPYHASSHNLLARSLPTGKRIPSLMALFMFLLIEPTGDRAITNTELMEKLLNHGVTRTDEKNVAISLDMSMLGDKKKKNTEDDFSSQELLFSLMGANSELDDSIGLKTDADKLAFKMQYLAQANAGGKKDKGFFKTHYVPFLAAMNEAKHLNTACYVALQAAGKEGIEAWLTAHPKEVEAFFTWAREYKWNANN